MAATVFTKGVITYLCIGLLLTLMGGPQASGLNNQLSAYFVNQSTGELSDQFKDTIPDVSEETGSDSGILAFIDSVRAIRDFLVFMGTVVLAIPMVLLDAQLPNMILIAFGVPTTVMIFIGFIYLVRSGS